MARYSLKPYQSTYVDPKSAEINNQLRQNFEASFNSDDALAGAVDEMDAAGFAGDQALLKELEGSTREALEQRASRGDYETMGMDVAKSARSFTKGYAPIKQNHAAQQAYRASIKEAYEKGVGKPGGIDAETYQKAMAMSTKDYDGLQKNEDGSIDEGSFFSGRTLVGDVDISARMSEYMEDFAAEKGGQTRTLQGQKRMGPDGVPFDDPEGATYQIKIGEKWETVSEADVAEAFRNVTSQPDVQAALQQKADLRTFNMTDEDLRQNLLLDLDGDINDEEDEGLRGALAEAVEKGKTKEAAALQAMIDQKEGLLGEAGIESTEEEMELRRQNARQEVMRGEMSREGNAAISKYGYTNVYSEYEEKYDKKWLQDRKASLDAKNFIPDLLTKSGMTQINNPGGNTIASIAAYSAEQDIALKGAVQKLNSDLGGTTYTAEDIISGVVTPEELEKLGVAPDILEGAQKRVRTIMGEQQIQKQLIKQANLEVNPKGIYSAFLKESIGDYSGQDILNEARSITGNATLTVEELAGMVKMTSTGDIQAELSSSKALNRTSEEAKKVFMDTYGDKYPNAGELWDARELTLTLQNLKGGNDTKFNRKILGVFDNANAKVNDWLEKNARITVGGYASSVMPGYDAVSAQKNTKAVKAAFEKQPLDKNFEIFYDGQKQDSTGTVAGLIAANEWDGEDVVVQNVKFHTSSFLGEPSLEFKVKGQKDGNDVYKTVIVPYSNLKNSGMDEYFNDPSYQMNQEVNRARNSGLDNTEIQFSGGGVFKFTGLKGDDTRVIYTDAAGKMQTITPESTMKDENGNKVKTLDYMIQDAAASGQTFYTNFEQ